MAAPILRAVYEQGKLRLLDPVPAEWVEGQEFYITVLSERESGRLALKDVAMKFDVTPDLDVKIDEAALFAQIAAEMKGKPPISEVIIDERKNGP